MDTKLKNSKYSLWIKGLCLLMSAALFAASGYMLTAAFRTLGVYGGTGVLTGKAPAFNETSLFRELFWEHADAVAGLTNNVQSATNALKNFKNKAVDAEANKYLDQKAAIIEYELLYAAQSDYRNFSGNKKFLYDESRGEYQDNASLLKYQQIAAELEKRKAEAQTGILPDKNAPLNIYAAQLIVNSVKGQDLLKYESCVRPDALNVSYPTSDNSENVSIGTIESVTEYTFSPEFENLTYSKEELMKQLSQKYDSSAEDYIKNMQSSGNYNRTLLSKTVNFKYYIRNNVTKQVDSNAGSADGFTGGKYRFAMLNGTVTEDKTGELGGREVTSLFTNAKSYTVYIWFENNLQPGDSYSELQKFYIDSISNSVNREIILGASAFLLSILVFAVLMCLSGYKREGEGAVTAWIDKLPWDIHFVISGGLCAGLIACAVTAMFQLLRTGPYRYTNIWTDPEQLSLALSAWLPAAAAVFGGLISLILIELIASAVRINKAGKPWVKKFASIMLLLWLFRCFIKFFKYIFKSLGLFFRVFTYKPKKLGKLTVLIILLYALLNTVFVLLCFASLVFVLFVIGINAAAVYFAARYANNLDKVITAAVERSGFIPADNLPPSLAMLANSLSYTNAELNRAINKAVKDERMKTELITNVSHDLKTPLTSVITYIDLLKKLDIKSEDAQKYIAVLQEKADKLKTLIDDLIEASKVSTGNVVLNAVNLNLAELTVQAMVEANPDFEKNGLEIRFDEPEKAPVVFADSQKTYRILENLLSNARKYSAPGTRVYIRIHESGGYGIFEVKNISKEPLNISPEELTERFVRGDRSRSEEGNGLGLSIAKELAALQNGRLEIVIDGDLFKAEVYLPAGK